MTDESASAASLSPPGDARRVVLDSGLVVALFPNPSVRSASAALRLRVGARDDPPGREGLAHFIEHMLFRGGRTFDTPAKRNRALAEVGGEFQASTGLEDTKFLISMHGDGFSRGMDIFLDALNHPRFDEQALATERTVVLGEVREELEEWEALERLRRDFVLCRWEGNAAIVGTLASVEAITGEEMAEHARRYYGPANAVLCIAGRFAPEEALARAAELRAMGDAPANGPRARGPRARGEGVVVHRCARQQCEVLLSFPARCPTSKMAAACDLLNSILGQGCDSRLFVDIREERGLAYSVGSSVEGYAGSTLLEVEALAPPERITEVVERILGHVEELARAGPHPEELARAQRCQCCALEYLLDDPAGLANHISWLETYFPEDAPHTVEAEIARMRAISADDVARAAAAILRREQMTALCVGPVPEELVDLLREATGAPCVELAAAD